jgi:hypothetical protein
MVRIGTERLVLARVACGELLKIELECLTEITQRPKYPGRAEVQGRAAIAYAVVQRMRGPVLFGVISGARVGEDLVDRGLRCGGVPRRLGQRRVARGVVKADGLVRYFCGGT